MNINTNTTNFKVPATTFYNLFNTNQKLIICIKLQYVRLSHCLTAANYQFVSVHASILLLLIMNHSINVVKGRVEDPRGGRQVDPQTTFIDNCYHGIHDQS